MSVENDLDNELNLDGSGTDESQLDYDQEEELLLDDDEEEQDGESEEDEVVELDDDDDSDEAAAAMPMKTKLMLGGLSLLGVGLVGFVGATKFGFIGGNQAQDVQWDQPAPLPETTQVVAEPDVAELIPQPEPAPIPVADKFAQELGGETPSNELATNDAVTLENQNTSDILNISNVEVGKEAKAQIQKIAAAEVEAQISEVEGAVADIEKKQEASTKKVDNVAKSLVAVKQEVANIRGLVSTKGDVDLSGVASKTELQKAFEQIHNIYTEVDDLKDAKAYRLSAKEVDVLIDGRKRLKGFKVVNVTADGTMSVVVTPSKRVQVYFEGERFSARGVGKLQVSAIKDNGHLLLVGNKYFIDDEYEALPVKAVTKPKAKPVVVKKPVVEKPRAKEHIASDNFGKQQTINGKAKALGWSLNGSYVDGFLVQTPSGKWLTVKIGSKLEGLGMIEGTDRAGNLIVGSHFIEKAQD
ncbi:hypothetical protein [Vibrio owensii]|uniref:hypothetical protein n=1 Tax=Vibrio owensii TaxID=696485 RepID=UPI003CC54DD6